jgi:hypothetical protein
MSYTSAEVVRLMLLIRDGELALSSAGGSAMLRKIAGVVAAAGMVVTVACGQTDAGITSNVKTKLAADEMVKAYQVDVDTQNRVVTLTGSVETPVAKERAITIARDTEGVRDVIDQLQVSEVSATSGIDVDIDVDDNVGRDVEGSARRAGEETQDTAGRIGDATADAAKKAGRATVDGAKKVGGAVRDAVTDDDPDSDNDGK